MSTFVYIQLAISAYLYQFQLRLYEVVFHFKTTLFLLTARLHFQLSLSFYESSFAAMVEQISKIFLLFSQASLFLHIQM